MMSYYKRVDLLSSRIFRQDREVVVSAKEKCSGMKIIYTLCIAMVLLALGSLFHVLTTEPVHGLRMLRGIKATPTSGATTQTVNVDEIEFSHARSMRFVLINDYPSSGANNRHSSYRLQMRGRADIPEPHTDVNYSFLRNFLASASI